MAPPPSSRRVLAVAFLVDGLDVVINLVVALLTGSAVVFAEMAKGLADASGAALLVIGERRAARPRDEEHPFGYAREAFFWALLSAIAMLVIGAGLSAWRGVQQLVEPERLETPLLALAVLAFSIATNGYSVSLSARKLVSESGSLRAALRNLDRPLVKGAMLRNAVGTITSVVGFVSLLLYQGVGGVIFDALGALFAAVFMFAASLVLMTQARALITGHTLPESEIARLLEAVRATPKVDSVNRLAAVYAGASEVLVDADLDLEETLDTTQIEAVLDDFEDRVRAILPRTTQVRFLLNSPESTSRITRRRQD